MGSGAQFCPTPESGLLTAGHGCLLGEFSPLLPSFPISSSISVSGFSQCASSVSGFSVSLRVMKWPVPFPASVHPVILSIQPVLTPLSAVDLSTKLQVQRTQNFLLSAYSAKP